MTRRDKARAHHAGRGKETNATLLRQALLRLLPYKLRGQGELGFPAVPALLDHYLENCRALFACFGRKITDAELEGVGKLLLPALEEGFRSSSRAEVLIQFETLVPPGNSLRYTVKLLPQSPADLYRTWTDTRTRALFGAQPDAMVMDTARSLGAAENVAVLDVGAGSGRNAIALAREIFKVDAGEPVPALASALRAEALKQRLEVRVCEGMFEDHALELPAQHYQL